MPTPSPLWAQQPTEQLLGTVVPSSFNAKDNDFRTSSPHVVDFSELGELRMENKTHLQRKQKAFFFKAVWLVVAHLVGFLLLAALCLQPPRRKAVGSGISTRRLAGYGDSRGGESPFQNLEELEEQCARTWTPLSPAPDGGRRSPAFVLEGLRDLDAGYTAPLATPELVSTLKQEESAPQPSGSGVLNSESKSEIVSSTQPATSLSSSSHTSLVESKAVSEHEGPHGGGLALALAASSSSLNRPPSERRRRAWGVKGKRLAAGEERAQELSPHSKVARTELVRPLYGSDDGPSTSAKMTGYFEACKYRTLMKPPYYFHSRLSTSSGGTRALHLAAPRPNPEAAKRFLNAPQVHRFATHYIVRRERIRLEGSRKLLKEAVALNAIRRLLVKPVLKSSDLLTLRDEVESLASDAAQAMTEDISQILPCRALPRMARRFLVFFTLDWVFRVMGDDMRRHEWWADFIRRIPSSYNEKGFASRCSKECLDLMMDLCTAVETYKRGQTVEDEVALHLIKTIFDSSHSMSSLRSKAWKSWVDDAKLLYITEGAIQEKTVEAPSSSDDDTE